MKKPLAYRWLFYILGMLVLALGLTLNTKTGLGVSPIISVSFAVSQIWGFNFGDATFILYILCVAGEIALQRRRNLVSNLLQILVSLVFSRVLNVYDALIAYDNTLHSLPENLLMLAAAMVCTGVGAALSVNAHLAANPGDGIVAAIGEAIGKEQGIAKNIVDISCVVFTCILSFLVVGRVVGIGLGTLCAMICVGRVISFFNKRWKAPMLRLSGLEPPAEVTAS